MLLLAPAVAACLYAIGSLGLKRSMEAGIPAARTNAVSNYAMALWSLPILLFLPGRHDPSGWAAALVAGAALFAGRWCAVRALQAGDLSLVAPLLGLKTVLVALFSLASGQGSVTPGLLAAAALASAGVILLQRGHPGTRHLRIRALALAFAASVLFAVTDVVVSSGAPKLGIGWFQPAMFSTIALLTLCTYHGPVTARGPGNRPLAFGSAVVGFQTSLMILAIGLTGQAVLINILYSSRALWSVLVDRIAGGHAARDFLASRLAGAALLTAAIILALLK